MRTLTVSGLALTLMLGAAGCDASHQRAAAPGAKAVHGTAGTPLPSGSVGASAGDAAGRAVVAMVDRADAMDSVHVVTVQQRSTSKVTMSGLIAWGGAGEGTDYTVAPSAIGMQGLNHQDRTEMRTVNGSEYVRIDPMPPGPYKGRTWIRLSLSTLGQGTADAMAEALEHSPVHRLSLMPSSGPVTLIGRETVDGRPAVHYRGTEPVDPRIVASRKVPATQRVDVWVGADGLPLRMITDDGEQRNTQDFTGFGGLKHIQEPPAVQTVDESAAKGTTA